MNAMILAAGLGTRLGSLGRATPNILLEIGDEPLLARHLRYLALHGVIGVVINIRATPRVWSRPREATTGGS